MIGLGLSIVQLAVRQLLGGAFTPAALFAANEPGAWYDPSDMTTLFQDAAGTTPVTAVEQPVGRMLDKSGRGSHATQATAINRPVLSARVNLLLNTETLSTQSVTVAATSQRLRFEGTGSITLSGTATGTYLAGTHTFNTTAGTLTLTVSGAVTRADLRVANDGIGLPAYQRVNTATDYDTAGFPLYLRFNGTNSWMQTGNINFTGTDKMTVWAGVRKLSDAARGIIVEQLTAGIGGVTVFALSGPQSSGGNNFAAFNNAVSAGSAISPVSAVLAGLYFPNTTVASEQAILKINGGPQILPTGTTIAIPTVNGPAFIGARAGNSLWFNGRLYSLIARVAQSTAQQIEQTEAWVNGKTKAYV